MPTYYPQSDNDFVAWLTNFAAVLSAAPTSYGETTTTSGALGLAIDAYTGALAQVVTLSAQAQAAINDKEVKKQAVIDLLTAMVGRMQNSSVMTDLKRGELDITVRDTEKTPAAVPTSRPVLTVDFSQRLQHTIHFVDENSVGGSKAKPDGVRSCDIYLYVGTTAPAGPNDFDYVTSDTRTPYPLTFDQADGAKNAYYIGRWVNTRGEHGPWSEVVHATITA